MTSCAWLWLYFGAFLMLAELLAPGFIIVFFGLSAVTVGGFRMVLGEAFTPTWQVLAFSCFAVLYIAVLRRWLKRVFVGTLGASATGLVSEQVGRTGRVVEAVRPPRTGRVLVGDAEWTASADVALDVGVDVRVVAQENLTLRIEGI